MTAGGDGESEESAAARLFALCWAFATLYHQIDYREALATPLDAAVTILAALLLLRPNASLLVALAAAQCLLVGQHLPHVYNHWYVTALTNVGLLAAAVVAWPRRRQAGALDGIVAAFAPTARPFLMLLYFLTGWHKLNTDFLTPGLSCASTLMQQMATKLGGLAVPAGFDSIAIAFTLLVELGVPLALLVTRTRTPAVLLALLFHAAMAVTGYARFSAAGVALLVLFLAPATQRRILAVAPLGNSRTRTAAVLALLSTVLLPWAAHLTFLLVQLALTAWIGWVVVRTGMSATTRTPILRGAGHPLPFVAPALLLLSAMAPYLGLQTDRAVAMYSNLRTEGGLSNHLVVPGGWQPFDFQRDLVVVVEGRGWGLSRLAGSGTVIPFAELRARASESTARTTEPIPLTYRRSGVVHHTSDMRSDSALALPASRLHRKLFRFRPVEASGPRACSV